MNNANMSLVTTNKNALKLLRIDGATLQSTNNKDTQNKQERRPISSRSNTFKLESNDTKPTFNCSNSNDNHHKISEYIRSIAEREPTPQYSSDSEEDEDEYLFKDRDNDKNQKHKKGDITDGIELMLQKLQNEAKLIEQKRYKKVYNTSNGSDTNMIIPNSTPNDIVRMTQNKTPSRHKMKHANMNWWDQPFRDHLRSAKRPIIRETGIDQFASEYMITLLRDQEQSVLKQRQQVEYQRTRKPLKNWYSMKGTEFGKELKRHVRQTGFAKRKC
eukprot:771044_1